MFGTRCDFVITTMKLRKKICSLFLFILLSSIIVYIYWLPERMHLGNFAASSFKFQNKKPANCSKHYFIPKIEHVLENVQHWNNSSNAACRQLFNKVTRMYELGSSVGLQTFGSDFKVKMSTWLKNSSVLLKASEAQTVVFVHDLYKQCSTVYNPLRSKRPLSKRDFSVREYMKNITKTSKLNCDFCYPYTMTAEDVFGRIQGLYSISASNAFKLNKWHGLFIPYEHSIFDLTEYMFLDLFNTSLKWFKKVSMVDRNARFPVFVWDMFPSAGASQTHVHIHGIAGVDSYPGHFKDIFNMVGIYQQNEGSDYWETLIEIHDALRLSLHFGKVILLSPLAPQREHELWLLCEKPVKELFQLLYYIIKMYQDVLEKFCFSLGGALPELQKENSIFHNSLPTVIFIGTRGDCASPVNDISSLELYVFNNVNTDPYTTIAELQDYLNKSSPLHDMQEMVNLW